MDESPGMSAKLLGMSPPQAMVTEGNYNQKGSRDITERGASQDKSQSSTQAIRGELNEFLRLNPNHIGSINEKDSIET